MVLGDAPQQLSPPPQVGWGRAGPVWPWGGILHDTEVSAAWGPLGPPVCCHPPLAVLGSAELWHRAVPAGLPLATSLVSTGERAGKALKRAPVNKPSFLLACQCCASPVELERVPVKRLRSVFEADKSLPLKCGRRAKAPSSRLSCQPLSINHSRAQIRAEHKASPSTSRAKRRGLPAAGRGWESQVSPCRDVGDSSSSLGHCLCRGAVQLCRAVCPGCCCCCLLNPKAALVCWQPLSSPSALAPHPLCLCRG